MSPEQKQQFVDQALEMHARGFNCAQCVAVSTCGQVGFDQDAVFRLVEGFGGGMGCEGAQGGACKEEGKPRRQIRTLAARR